MHALSVNLPLEVAAIEKNSQSEFEHDFLLLMAKFPGLQQLFSSHISQWEYLLGKELMHSSSLEILLKGPELEWGDLNFNVEHEIQW